MHVFVGVNTFEPLGKRRQNLKGLENTHVEFMDKIKCMEPLPNRNSI